MPKLSETPQIFWRRRLLSVLSTHVLQDVCDHPRNHLMTRENLVLYILGDWSDEVQRRIERHVFSILKLTSDEQPEYMALTREEVHTIVAIRNGQATVKVK
jgi:hypothetical protein